MSRKNIIVESSKLSKRSVCSIERNSYPLLVPNVLSVTILYSNAELNTCGSFVISNTQSFISPSKPRGLKLIKQNSSLLYTGVAIQRLEHVDIVNGHFCTIKTKTLVFILIRSNILWGTTVSQLHVNFLVYTSRDMQWVFDKHKAVAIFSSNNDKH